MMEKTMDKIVALAKARGFVYPGSEIYGGLANTWDYGNLGVELKNNVKKIVIPAFGGATGRLAPDVIAEEMFKAYIQVFKIDIKIHSWRDLAEREDIMYQYIKSKK